MSNTTGIKDPSEYNGGELNFSSPDNVTVGSSTTAVVAANNNRKYLTITNISDESIFIAWSEDAEQNKGEMLTANGGTRTWFNPPTNALNAICASGSKLLAIQEAS